MTYNITYRTNMPQLISAMFGNCLCLVSTLPWFMSYYIMTTGSKTKYADTGQNKYLSIEEINLMPTMSVSILRSLHKA